MADACELCGLPLYSDDLFNRDMLLMGSSRRRVRCFNDHGVIINGDLVEFPSSARLCMECAHPLSVDAKEQTRYHLECSRKMRKRGRSKFKAGFLPS